MQNGMQFGLLNTQMGLNVNTNDILHNMLNNNNYHGGNNKGRDDHTHGNMGNNLGNSGNSGVISSDYQAYINTMQKKYKGKGSNQGNNQGNREGNQNNNQ